VSILEVHDVSIRYITGDFKDIGLKEYVMKRLKGQYEVTEFWADRSVSFTLERGEMLGIIGTNGAGKSTLLKAVAGIMEPTGGSVERQGDMAALLELASGFDGDLTVQENAYLRGAMLGYTRSFMDEKYDDIIAFAELENFQERPFRQLSSGMKSRLAFAIASLVQPDLLILDEVLSVGDGAFRKKSEDKMKEIISGGAATILVSHSIEQVRELCTKVLWLDHGEQIAYGENVDGICRLYQQFLNGQLQLKDVPSRLAPQAGGTASGEEAETPWPEPRVSTSDISGRESCKTMSVKSLFKRCFLTLLAFVGVGYLALAAVYMLPTDRMWEHVDESAGVIQAEGPYPQLIPGRYSSQLDNWSESILLDTAACPGSGNAFLDAIWCRRPAIPGMSPAPSLVAVHIGQETGYDLAVYPRYWHGYLLYLKPLLLVFNYQQIRQLLQLVHLGAMLWAALLLGKRGKGRYIFPLLLTYVFWNPSAYMLSLHFTPNCLLATLQLIFILLNEKKYQENLRLWFYHFFVVGCLTVYFDMLTFPLVTFGVPMAFLLSQYVPSMTKGIRQLMGSGIAWGMGYASMWCSKWVLGTVITGENIFPIASIKDRLSRETSEGAISLFDVLKRNLNGNRFILLLAFAIFAVCVAAALVKNRQPLQRRLRCLPILAVAVLPFIWYVVLANHSYIHFWFTFRVLGISVFAALATAVMLLEKGPEKLAEPIEEKNHE